MTTKAGTDRTVYRGRHNMALQLGAWGTMMLVLVIAVFEEHRVKHETWQSIVVVVGAVVLTSPAVRAALSMVRVSEHGLVIRNPLRTYHVEWRDIDHIGIETYKASMFELCVIHRANGAPIPAYGLATFPGRPKRRASIEAREAVEALQGRLAAARAGRGSTRQQIES